MENIKKIDQIEKNKIKDKKYLILSDDNNFTDKISKALYSKNVNKKNILHIDNVIDALKFYDFFSDKIDILIVDKEFDEKNDLEKIKNKNKKNNKPTLIIKKPFEVDSFINLLLNDNNKKEIEKHLKKTIIEDNKEKIKFIQGTFNYLKYIKNVNQLMKYVDMYYLQSFQTQTHIKNIIRYTDYFSREILNSNIKLFDNYKKEKKNLEKLFNDNKIDKKSEQYLNAVTNYNNKKKIFENHIKLFFPKIFESLSLKKIKNFDDFEKKLKNELKVYQWEVVLSSFFHDIGKNFIPIELLDSEKSYDEVDKAIMSNHVKYGNYFINLLEETNKEEYDYKIIKNGINEHHNSNNNISSEGKLIRIIDIFEACSNMRTYKPAFTFDRIKEIIFQENLINDEFYGILYEQFEKNEPEFYLIYLENLIHNKKYNNQVLTLSKYENITPKNKKIINDSIKNILLNLTVFENSYSDDAYYLLHNIDSILDSSKSFNIDKNKVKNIINLFDEEIFTQFNNKIKIIDYQKNINVDINHKPIKQLDEIKNNLIKFINKEKYITLEKDIIQKFNKFKKEYGESFKDNSVYNYITYKLSTFDKKDIKINGIEQKKDNNNEELKI